MLSVDEALKLVLDHAEPLPARQLTLDRALGCLLAEPIASDIDSPPHDKSIVDGYAVVASSVTEPGTVLRVLEEVTAGELPTHTVEPGTATRIMTGAPLPAGADAVVMVEKTSLEKSASSEWVTIHEPPCRAGQNIVRRGTSIERGQTVLPAGRMIRAIEVGLLAEVGRDSVSAIPRPRVAILATGNELVPHGQVPSAGQIRNSNGPLLAGLARQAGGEPHELGIARDEQADLARLILQGLAADVLVLSGGVSAGVLDLVPRVLADLGVREVFHKVNLKPGKPLWFGERTHLGGRRTLVFGLPGNPVSSLVCFELFVRPAIAKLRGDEPRGLQRIWATLATDHKQRGDRPTYWPAKLTLPEFAVPSASECREQLQASSPQLSQFKYELVQYFSHEYLTPLSSIQGFAEVLQAADNLTDNQRAYADNIRRSGKLLSDMLNDVLQLTKAEATAPRSGWLATPLPWQGSGDLRTLGDADCLAYFPPGDHLFKAYDPVEVLMLPEAY